MKEIKVRVSDHVKELLDKEAKDENISLSDLVRQILSAYVNAMEKERREIARLILEKRRLKIEVNTLKREVARLAKETEEFRKWERFNAFIDRCKESLSLLDNYIKHKEYWLRDASTEKEIRRLLNENIEQLRELRIALDIRPVKVSRRGK